MPGLDAIRSLCLLAVWTMFGPGACGFTHAQLGTPITDFELTSLDGPKQHLFGPEELNAILYFRPGQDFSLMALQEVAAVQKELAGRSIYWVAVVPGHTPDKDAQGEARQAGLAMPVLMDEGDRLYGQLGVAQLPVVVMIDHGHRLAAYESFRKVNYQAVVRARLRFLLKEISEQEMAEALNPPAATTDSDEAAAHRRLTLAARLLHDGKYDAALNSVAVSLERNPTAEAYLLRGDILAAQGKCADAAASYNEALKLEPANERAKAGVTCPAKP
ncbi:MAG: tetratricopeptide repeat protein [Acidobacteriota bacterium]|nr:tetratricopeptide repeat protein [Acidobacteriota bacterium]